MIKVYKIVNDHDIVEYVGMTYDIEERFRRHTEWKPQSGAGKFYQREDVRLEVISEWETRHEARKAEVYWQNVYNVRDGGGYSRRQWTPEEIEYIRTSPLKTIELAQELGVNRGYISRIRNYKIYEDV